MHKKSSQSENSQPYTSTYVAIPLNTLKANMDSNSAPVQVVRNFVLQTLSPPNFCLADATDILSAQNYGVDNSQAVVLGNGNSVLDTLLYSNGERCNEQITLQHSQNNVDHASLSNVNLPSKPVYTCFICKEKFVKPSLYRKHMATHRNAKKFKCDQCSAGFNMESNFQLHMVVHNNKKNECPLCKITFQRLASLKSHLLLHLVDEMYKCEECMAEFDKEEQLFKHKQSHQRKTQDNSSMVCSYCKIQFQDSVKYKEHINCHIKVKKLVLKSKKSKRTQGNKEHRHVCKTCNKKFLKLSLLERHERIHAGEKPFVCQVCDKSFNQKGTLHIHLSKHSGIKPFECTLCPAKFRQKGNLRTHVKKTHMATIPGEKAFRCLHCSCIFKKLASLNAHMSKMHPSSNMDDFDSVMKQLKALEQQTSAAVTKKETVQKEITDNAKDEAVKEVPKTMNSISSTYVKLTEHCADGSFRGYLVKKKKSRDSQWYICNYCARGFKKPSDLIRHIRVHTMERPFKCSQCGSKFALKTTLANHVKTHYHRKNYTCSLCPKQFSSIRMLHRHIRTHNKIDNEMHQYKCKVCSMVLKSLHDALEHVKEASHKKCELENTELEIIIKPPLVQTEQGLLPVGTRRFLPYVDDASQKEIRPFGCDVCSASFKKKVHLKRHMLIHSGVKRFSCERCSKLFYTGSSLRQHMKFHMGIKNHGCKECGKKFVTMTSLKRHMVTHSTNKPYFCPYCSKRFKGVTLCRKHIKIHERELDVQVQKQNIPAQQQHLENALQAQIVISDDLQLIDNVNLQSLYPQLKLETSDSSLFGTLNDIQDSTVFNTDSIRNQIVSQATETCTRSEALSTQVPVQDNLLTSINDIAVINEVQNEKNVELSSIRPNLLVGNLGLYPNLNFDSQTGTEISLPLNVLSPNSDILTSSLDLNGEQIPLLDLVSGEHAENVNATNNDDNTNYFCTSCLGLFQSLDIFKKHVCKPKTANSIDSAEDHLSDVLHCTINVLEGASNVGSTENIGSIAGTENNDTDAVQMVQEKIHCSVQGCGSTFVSETELSEHTKKNHGKMGHACSFCEKVFKKPSDLTRHVRTHTGEKPYVCRRCDKSFSLKSTLVSHFRVHDPAMSKQYKCEVCNSFFTTKAALKVHLLRHTGKKPYQCPFCPMKFRTTANRKLHESTKHDSNNPSKKSAPKPKIMDILLASITADNSEEQRRDLTQDFHVKDNNTTEQNMVCNTVVSDLQLADIPEGSDLMSELNSTLRTQSLDEIHSTDIVVPETFMLDSGEANLLILDDGTILNIRKISESNEQDITATINAIDFLNTNGDRNHECPICLKRYKTKVILKKHLKTHGVNKQFPCTKCNKGFDKEDELDIHLKTHLGLRPYLCSYCDNSFMEESNLKSHMKMLHGQSSSNLLGWDILKNS